MSFLAPAFLVALATLAVPVLLHLVQRERKRVVEFPSLMFLRRIPYQSVRRRRLRDWTLLALRLAALALIVLAFARPLIKRAGLVATAASGPRELVVMLDTSYSMGYGDRWGRAAAAAQRAVDGMAAGDRGTVVLFSSNAQAEARSVQDRTRLRAIVSAAKPGAGATRYGPALRLAQSVLAASPLPRKELVVVSDFQKVGWSRDAMVTLPQGAVLTPVDVGGGSIADAGVTAVTLQRTTVSGQERVAVVAAIANRGDRPAQGVSVTLEIDGRAAGHQTVDIQPHASSSVTFPPLTITAANTRGTIRLAPDALKTDDVFHFVVSPTRTLPVVLVEHGTGESVYLSRALAIGDSPKFDVRTTTVDRLSEIDLRPGAVLILNDVVPASADLRRLRSFVERGAGMLVIAGEHADWGAVRDLLPFTPGAPVDRAAARPGVLSNVEFGHAVFEPFKPPRKGDFSTARFYRYRALAVGDTGRAVARLDDGAVALAEGSVGQGRLAVWTSTMDTYWNDLAVKPVFLPFVHGLIRYMGQDVETPGWMTVGQVADLGTLRNPSGGQLGAERGELVSLSPVGERLVTPRTGRRALELSEQGFYEVLVGNARPVAVIAANADPAEADLTPFDPREMVAGVSRSGTPAASGGAAPSLEDQERQSALWWYVLLLAVALLAAETVLSNRLSRAEGRLR
jgi:hypothetical protein